MTTIAELLKQALLRKGWSISEAARETGLDRSFLSRLSQGKPPPRSRSGRHGAEHDERYHELAKALGLDVDDFVETVARAQHGDEEIGLADYYPEFREALEAHLPVRTDGGIHRLLRAGLESLDAERSSLLYEQVSSLLDGDAHAVPAQIVSRDYFGRAGPETVPLRPRRSHNKRLCRRIGDALLAIDDVATIRGRVRLSALFYELSSVAAEV